MLRRNMLAAVFLKHAIDEREQVESTATLALSDFFLG
jgi:hypothetical protein